VLELHGDNIIDSTEIIQAGCCKSPTASHFYVEKDGHEYKIAEGGEKHRWYGEVTHFQCNNRAFAGLRMGMSTQRLMWSKIIIRWWKIFIQYRGLNIELTMRTLSIRFENMDLSEATIFRSAANPASQLDTRSTQSHTYHPKSRRQRLDVIEKF
jgi:hypothetical protein